MGARKRIMVMLAIVACTLTLASGVASGTVAFHGADYSSVPGHGDIRICDYERDGNMAKVQYQLVTDGSFFQWMGDGNGSNRGCNTAHYTDAVEWHQTYECYNFFNCDPGGFSRHHPDD